MLVWADAGAPIVARGRVPCRSPEGGKTMDDTRINACRDDVPFLRTCTFLNHAAIAPISLTVRRAIIRGTERMLDLSPASTQEAEAELARGRALAAALVGARAERVAYVQNTSIGMSMLALGVDAAPGDNIVVPAMDFPSNFLPWIQMEAKGLEVRRVAVADGRVTAAALAPHVDRKTRVVALSHVQYYNGFRVALAPIGQLCHGTGALLVVDGTQSIGAVPLDCGAAGVDVLVVASHKWLMGPVGAGFMAFSDRAMNRIQPRLVGWLSVKEPFAFHRALDFLDTAERFEPGSKNCAGIYGLSQRLATIREIGMEAIERRLMALVGHLLDGMEGAGLEPVIRLAETERSGIVLIKPPPSTDPQTVYDRLTQAGFMTSLRGGAIRVSPHYHNTREELDALIDVLRPR